MKESVESLYRIWRNIFWRS